MATPILDATPAGVTANAYATVAEADAYHDARLHRDDWEATGADVATKTVALIMATRLLDAMYCWESWATNPQTQALQWPRVAMLARNQLSYIPNDVIPAELKNATAEYARQLIAADRSADSDIETQKIKSLTAGPVSLTFGDGVVARPVPDAVVSLLPSWWGYVRGRVSATRELVRA
jgi:hypothetical protein